MANAAVMSQAQGDIRHRHQKLEGFTGMNASQVLEVPTKGFVSHDQAALKAENKKEKKKMQTKGASRQAATLVKQTEDCFTGWRLRPGP